MKTPELDKMLAVKEQSRTISEFLDWLDGQEFEICKYDEDASYEENLYRHIDKTKEQILAEFFGIDLVKCEQERQQILDDLRKQNNVNSGG